MSACTSYPDDLKQKLTDLPPKQRRMVLAQECKDLISEGLHSNNPKIIEHAQRMQKICEEMTGQEINLS